MVIRGVQSSIRMVVLLGILALAVGACGDSDGGGSGSNAADASAADSSGGDPTTTGSDEEQVRATMRYIRATYKRGDGKGYCSKLTAAGQRKVVTFGQLNYGGNDWTCPSVITQLRKMAREANVKDSPATTASVKVEGDKATAMVTDSGRPPVPIELVRSNDEWKIPDPGFNTTAAGPIDQLRR